MTDHYTLTAPNGLRAAVCSRTGELLRVWHPNGAELTAGSSAVARLGLRDRRTSELLVLSTADAGSVRVEEHPDGVRGRYTDWEALELEVTVLLRPVATGLAWTAGVRVDAAVTVEWLEIGSVVVPDDLNGPAGAGRIVWPWSEGVLVDTVELRDQGWLARTEPSYPSRSLDSVFPAIICSQFIAHHNDDGGLILTAQDSDSTPKMIEYGAVSGGIELVVRTYASGATGAYEQSFDIVLGHYDGGWYGAAESYRAWFESVTHLVPAVDRADLPTWYLESPLILTYPVRGANDREGMAPNKLFPFSNGLSHVERLAALTGVPVMALLMHWEGTAPWAPPFVWPPYGGVEGLERFGRELHSGGNLLGLYCSGIGWTQTSCVTDYDRTAEFASQGWAEVMCRAPDGSLPLSTVCTNQRSGYDLCPAHERVLPTMAAELDSMLAAGVDYVQLYDQNTGGHSLFCYDTEHGHGHGPGLWQVTESLRVQRALLASATSRDAFLGTEFGAAEPYLETFPMSDLRFEVAYGVGTPIPLYQYLYHRYVTNFMGNQVVTHHLLDHERSPENLLYRLAYAFTAGELLTLSLTDDGDASWNWGSSWEAVPDQQPVLQLVGELSRWRSGAASPFLARGTMVAAHTHAIEDRAIARTEGPDLVVPQVLNTRWRASDGSMADVFVNWTGEPAAVDIDPATVGRAELELVRTPDGARDRLAGERLVIEPLSMVLLIDTSAAIGEGATS